MSKLTSNPNGTLSYDSEKTKKEPTKRRASHKCTEKVQLDRMRLILVGNGDPKTGLAFKMEQSIKDISDIKSDISEIKTQLKETITAASTAASSLEKYKIEVKSFNDGKNDIEERQSIAENLRIEKENQKRAHSRDNWYKILTIAGIIIAIYFGFRNNKNTDKVVENTDKIKSETQITNDILIQPTTRGNIYNPFASDTIK